MTATADISSSIAATDVDADARQIGVVYAKALFAAATKAGNVDEVMADFERVIAVVDAHPEFTGFSSGMVSAEDLSRAYRRAFEGKVAPLFVSFLGTLVRHGRQQALRAVFRAFREMNDARTGQVRVEVVTPVALDDAVRNRLASSLQASLGHTPILESRVDPRLIGGLMLRVGDTLFDGSVATQLEKIRTQMIDRTVHEIQSRRDRFRPAAGN